MTSLCLKEWQCWLVAAIAVVLTAFGFLKVLPALNQKPLPGLPPGLDRPWDPEERRHGDWIQ